LGPPGSVFFPRRWLSFLVKSQKSPSSVLRNSFLYLYFLLTGFSWNSPRPPSFAVMLSQGAIALHGDVFSCLCSACCFPWPHFSRPLFFPEGCMTPALCLFPLLFDEIEASPRVRLRHLVTLSRFHDFLPDEEDALFPSCVSREGPCARQVWHFGSPPSFAYERRFLTPPPILQLSQAVAVCFNFRMFLFLR